MSLYTYVSISPWEEHRLFMGRASLTARRLEQAYRQVVAKYRLHYDSEAAQALGQSVGSWPAFEDSAECLSRLKALGFKLAILANVDNHSFKE